MKILDGGERSYIGIGLSAAGSNLNNLPGWKWHSYGYHGDDGNKFEVAYSGTGRKYGQTFTTNDIIGNVITPGVSIH